MLRRGRSVYWILLFPLWAVFAARADLALNGQITQGALVQGKVDAGARVILDGAAVRVSDDGDFLIGFGRDHGPDSRLEVIYPDGRRETRRLDVAAREYDIQRIDGLPPSKVTPKPEDLKRIREEAARVHRARAMDDPRTDFLSGWIWPSEGRISGVYGSQRVLNGEPRRPHFGVDIAAPVGTPVKAPADGVVTLVHADMFYSGGTLVIDHGHNLSSSFLHLNRILVAEGARVKKGEIVAEIGKTGRVTGAHLDWRMNLGKARLDPQLLVPPMQSAERDG